jgi:O-antigen/teichoic acid export membrane protein
LLTLVAILSSVSGFVGSNFLAARESRYFLYSSIWGAVSSVIGNMLLIPGLGIMGASIVVPVSFAVMVVCRIIYARKYVRIQGIPIYLLILFIAIATIVVVIYMQTIWLKYCLLIGFFCIFICISIGSIKEYFLRLRRKDKV